MKSKFFIMLAVLGMVGFVANGASADPSGQASAHVYLTVDPNIAVQAIDANVDLGTTQTGDVSLPITFRIDANTEGVAISGLVTDLYKGDDPNGTEVAPIPVNLSAGFPIDPDNANEIAGGDGIASYVNNPTYNGFVAHGTEQLTFESSQNGHFSQNVLVSPTWNNTDNEKPQGEYSGWVVLYSSIVD
jgi:hypothetical protein